MYVLYGNQTEGSYQLIVWWGLFVFHKEARYEKKVTIRAVLIIGIILILGMLMVSKPFVYSPMPEACSKMDSGNDVKITPVYVPSWLNYYYVFEPRNKTSHKGFIFYPGAFVDPRAYAPAARLIAARGYLTIIVGMPFHLAIFGYARADTIIKNFQSIKTWVIGGHSLGGRMACKFASCHQDQVRGLVLWASRPSEQYMLNENNNLKVISIYGTNDGLVTSAITEESRKHLPKSTIWVKIVGGNHSQFGWYGNGIQRFDKPASITHAAQQEIITDFHTEKYTLL